MSDNIGTIIMKKRKQLGYTQQKIVDYMNVSFQAVSKWENGTAYPDISLLPQLAHILGTTTDTLLGYSAAPHQHCMDILIAEKMDVKPGRV